MKKLLFTVALAALLPIAGRSTELTDGKSRNIVYIHGVKYHLHTVRGGETLADVARTYGVSVERIQQVNPSAADGLREEQTLKIPVSEAMSETSKPLTVKEEKRLKKSFLKHEVAQGETLYAISRRYHISVETLLEDNPEADPQHLAIGQELLIRKTEVGRTDDDTARAEMAEYGERLNDATVGEEFRYHVVQPKETIYGLSRLYGLSEEEFVALNGLEEGLKAGAIVKVPNPDFRSRAELAEEVFSTPEEPDTLAAAPVEEVVFHALRPSETLRTALLLPLTSEGRPNKNFTAFYQGFLLGLEDVKRSGYSVDLHLYDTQRNTERLALLLEEEPLREAHLIVGPIYADGIEPILHHAEQAGVPMVSPLADFSHLESDVLFQMAPTDEHKYDKLQPLLADPEYAITLIRTKNNDKEFEAEILEQLRGRTYRYHDYESVQGVENAERSDLTPLLQQHGKHLFFVLPDNEVDVDRILASLASAQTNLQARSLGSAEYMVVGSTRWNRYTNIDRTTFFKNRVILFSLLHAKRDSEAVKIFDSRYIRAFGTLPTLYAYRGYETAVIFCRGMFSEIEYDMEGRRYRPLQSTYTFRQEEGSRTHINQEWTRVNYNANFTITLE